MKADGSRHPKKGRGTDVSADRMGGATAVRPDTWKCLLILGTPTPPNAVYITKANKETKDSNLSNKMQILVFTGKQ